MVLFRTQTQNVDFYTILLFGQITLKNNFLAIFLLYDMRGDGNCLFRSFADQIERDENLHANYRTKCIAYMRTNRDEFEPFMTEDYDDYVDEMAQLQGKTG